MCGAVLAIIGAIHFDQVFNTQHFAFHAICDHDCLCQGALRSRSFVHDFVVTELAGQDVTQIVKLSHPKFMLRMLMKEKDMPPPVAK